MAWQFDRPDLGEGHAQIFRRTNSPIATMSFPFQGLEPEQTYEVVDFDKAEKSSFSGKELMKTGLTVTLPPRGSAIFQYKLLKPTGRKKK
jgi:hypothetical protein